MAQPKHSWIPDFEERLLERYETQVGSLLVGGKKVSVYECNLMDKMMLPAVFLGDTAGEHDITNMRAARKTRSEEFSAVLWFVADVEGQSSKKAKQAVFKMMGALEDLLALSPTLDLDPTVTAKVGRFKLKTSPSPTSLGWRAFLRVEIPTKTRLV